MEQTTPTYLVECYWPDISQDQARAALAGLARAQDGASASDRVWPLGCILVPSDGLALFLVAGSSAEAIHKVGERIALPFDRIVESTSIAAETTPAMYAHPSKGA